MHFRLLVISLLFCSHSLHAQEPVSMPEASKLRWEIASLPEGEKQVDAILRLVKYMHTQAYPADSVMPLLMKSEYLSDKTGYRDGLRRTYRDLGVTYETLSRDYTKALSWYQRALNLAANDQQHHELVTSILNLNFYLGDFVSAMALAAGSLKKAEAAGDEKLIAHYHNVIGFIHLRQHNAGAALQSYEHYHQLAMNLSDSFMMGDAYTSLAETYLLDRQFTTALDYLFRAKALYERLDARKKLAKGDRLPYTYFKIGFAYGQQGNKKQALNYVMKAIAFTSHVSCNLYDVANYYIYAGNLFLQEGNSSRSFEMLRKGLSIAEAIDHKEDIRDAYLYLHRLFAGNARYDSAYYYYSLYDSLKDSISNERTRREIRQIEASYKVEKKDREIQMLLQQGALQEASTRRKLLIRNLVIIFFVFVAIIIAFLLNRRDLRRKNERQKEVNRVQNEIFNIVSSTQDQERKRIAQDLHDGMGTLLSAAKLKLSSLPANDQALVDASRILDDAIAEMRNISHNLMPATLSRIGLVGALQNFFGKMNGPLQFNFIHDGFHHRIDEEKEIILYRVVLELVNNAVKHADARTVTIQLLKYPDSINLVVEDDGRGMSRERSDGDGIGLRNIASRISYLKGKFTMDSGSSGTTAIIDIPI